MIRVHVHLLSFLHLILDITNHSRMLNIKFNIILTITNIKQKLNITYQKGMNEYVAY